MFTFFPLFIREETSPTAPPTAAPPAKVIPFDAIAASSPSKFIAKSVPTTPPVAVTPTCFTTFFAVPFTTFSFVDKLALIGICLPSGVTR